MRALAKRAVKRGLRFLGYEVVPHGYDYIMRSQNIVALDLSAYSPHTVVSPDRLHVLASAAMATRAVPGDVVECGVYRGGSAMVLRDYREPSKHLYLLDTFEGIPDLAVDADMQDGAFYHSGDFTDTSLEAVRSVVGGERTTYLPGLFSERFPEITERAFSFVHVDADLYQSVAECIEFFVPRLSPGAVMVFDDYGFKSCPGAKRAVDERLAVVWLPTGQAVYFHR